MILIGYFTGSRPDGKFFLESLVSRPYKLLMANLGDEYLNYMGHLWVSIEGDVVTVGVHEEALGDLDDISKIDLPPENEAVEKDEICGELETKDGSLNLYAPVEGTVFEINSAILDNPDLIHEDPYGDGWIIKIQANNIDEVKELTMGSGDEA